MYTFLVLQMLFKVFSFFKYLFSLALTF